MPNQSNINNQLAQSYLQKLMNEGNFVGREQYNFGRDTLFETKGDINYLQDFFKNILEGKDTGKLLDFVNTDEINKNYDTAIASTSELAPRGGLRTSTLGNLDFSKMADIQKLIEGIRAKSPDALTQLAGMLGNLGSGSVAAGQQGFAQQLQAVLAQLQLNEAAKDRKNSIIGGLISAAGGIGGAIAGGVFGGKP